MSRARLVAVLLALVLTVVGLTTILAPPVAATPMSSAVRAAPAAPPRASAMPPSLASPPAPPSARAALAQSILQKLKTAGVPAHDAFLPNLAAKIDASKGYVEPLYGEAPAPMGIGDFGVRNTTGTAEPYFLQSTSWQATVTLDSANTVYLDSGVPDWFGMQLNAVMTNTTVAGNDTYRYWIQNVVQYSTLTNSFTFIDNIWNFSNPSTLEPASTFYSGNGTPVDPVFYYDIGPSFTVPFPFTIHLYVNSSLTTNVITQDVWSTVRFGYDLLDGTGGTIAAGVYDTVLFNSRVKTINNPPVPKFSVDGFKPNPVGLLDDSEVMIGGPGGGSTTSVFAISGSERLEYRNATSGRYQNDPTAWNEGTDTGETVEGVSETYTTPGTVDLSLGPSIPMPFWNATPGGNEGRSLMQGSVSPSNAFVFFNQGSSFDQAQAAWAPVPASGAYAWALPPGSYYREVLASEFDAARGAVTLTAGTATMNVALTADRTQGVYTPLWAWNNAQIANISSGGAGTSANPYLLDNNEFGPLDSLFGEFNDYTYPVFSGIFLAYTDAFVSINQPASFYVVYPANYDRALSFFRLPTSNRLAIQAYYASDISIWQGSFTGWFSSFLFFGGVFAPIGNVGFWAVTHSLIGASTFTDLGSALVSGLGEDNVVWGNAIVPGSVLPSFYASGDPLGIQLIEGGDLVYNNFVTTTIPAYAPNFNFYTGAPQINKDDWNLSAPEPASAVTTFNGYPLTGSIVGAATQCGNFWGNYIPGAPLPYNDFGFIETGGDECPYSLGTYPVPGVPLYTLTFTEGGLASGSWSVTVGGTTRTAAAGSPVVFQVPNGTWTYAVGAIAGRTVTPSSGTLTVIGVSQAVPVVFGPALAATATSSPTTIDAGQSVHFAATATGGSGTYTYAWVFGDGGTDASASPSHAYANAGAYTVNVWVNDSTGGSQHSTLSVLVNRVPTAAAAASPATVDVGQAVAFTGTSANGTAPMTYSWDFGDGSLSSAQNPSHSFAAAGSYTVHLTVTDAAGVSATASKAVTVNALPVASVSASTNAPTAGDTVTFTGSSTGGTPILGYAWTFGDGASSTDQSPTHAFTTPGTYTVTLKVTDSTGASSTTTLTVVVSASTVGTVSTTLATVYAILGLVVGVLVGALVAILLRRRRSPGSQEPPQEPSP